MVFTISCSGDDGKNGTDGVSCNAVTIPDVGYDIQCGGVSKGTLYFTGQKGDPGADGKDGKDGEGLPAGACYVAPASGVWHAYCRDAAGEFQDAGSLGSEAPTDPNNPIPPSGGCLVRQEDPYNSYEIKIACDSSDPIYLCNGRVFSKTTYVCGSGLSRTQDVNSANYPVPGAIGALATSATPPVSNFSCATVNGNEKYDPNAYFCVSGTPQKLVPLCGGASYASASNFCYKAKDGLDSVKTLCGTSLLPYNNTQFCKGGTVAALCEGKFQYDETTTFCVDDLLQQKCGSGASAPYYVVATHFCNDNATTNAVATGNTNFGKPLPFCGKDRNGDGIVYNENATGGTIGAGDYGSANYLYTGGGTFCQNGVKVTKCSEGASNTTTNQATYYDATKEFCRKNTNTATQSTNKTEVAPLCFALDQSGLPTTTYYDYDGATYFCDATKGTVGRACAGAFYDDAKEFCWNNSVIGTKCATGGDYNPDLSFCSYNSSNIESAVAYCPSSSKTTYNVGGWQRQYCVKPSTDATAVSYVLTCGINQEPDYVSGTTPANSVAVSCKCMTGKETIFNGNCALNSTSSDAACTALGGTATNGVCTCGDGYVPGGTIASPKCVVDGHDACDYPKVWDPYLTTPACAANAAACSNAVAGSPGTPGTATDGICDEP